MTRSLRAPALVGAAALCAAFLGVSWFAVDKPARLSPPPTTLMGDIRTPTPLGPDVRTEATDSAPAGTSPTAEVTNEAERPASERASTIAPATGTCDWPTEPPDAASSAAQAQLRALRQATDAALQRRLDAMRSSADAGTRAAALMALQDHRSLAAMARHTRDPAVYAYAWTACSRAAASADVHCQALSTEQWSRLDPGNAAPLLRAADAALERGDPQAMANALHRAALAPRMTHRELGFAAQALSDPSFATATEASAVLGAAVIGVQLALPLSGHPALRRYCARNAVASDVNRHLLCDALARLLAERGDTLLDVGLGRRIGEQLGWPAEKLELIAARQHHHMMNWPSRAPANLPSCEGAHWVAQQVEQISRVGEREALEASLRAHPVSDAELLARYRQRQAPAVPPRSP